MARASRRLGAERGRVDCPRGCGEGGRSGGLAMMTRVLYHISTFTCNQRVLHQQLHFTSLHACGPNPSFLLHHARCLSVRRPQRVYQDILTSFRSPGQTPRPPPCPQLHQVVGLGRFDSRTIRAPFYWRSTRCRSCLKCAQNCYMPW